MHCIVWVPALHLTLIMQLSALIHVYKPHLSHDHYLGPVPGKSWYVFNVLYRLR